MPTSSRRRISAALGPASRGAGLLACAAAIALTTACGSDAPADDPSSTAAPTSQTPLPPPPTKGTVPWGADLNGFAQKEVRCDGGDIAVRMMWTGENRFVACRNLKGIRYLKAWTRAQPSSTSDTRRPFVAMRGEFFTDTPNSMQFTTSDGAKFDLGPTIVTIQWPKANGSRKTISTSYTTGAGWTRLD
ncbi:hypothetical protein [Gordonia phthalatica]|uniref:Lipoprotein n=1 Tax=Gordonia phthalatica TaxID=1136941 RepID=A0A0N9MUX5_9ACTN|nr:hypothetical protein [Gordonia phthalatica]ALG86442.1 hypothetical protein ACH46_20545 [Gordonia phthalatica]